MHTVNASKILTSDYSAGEYRTVRVHNNTAAESILSDALFYIVTTIGYTLSPAINKILHVVHATRHCFKYLLNRLSSHPICRHLNTSAKVDERHWMEFCDQDLHSMKELCFAFAHKSDAILPTRHSAATCSKEK